MTNTDQLSASAEARSEQPASLLARAELLEHQLEQLARSNGYSSYAEMRERLEQGNLPDRKTRARLRQQLRELTAQEASVGGSPTPVVDATGLVAINDIIRSVARLIRILLVGYTEDEVRELLDRKSAAHARALEERGRQLQELHTQAIMERDRIARQALARIKL